MDSKVFSEKERLLSRFAIDVGKCESIAFVRRFVGTTYAVEDGVLRPKKQWADTSATLPVLLPLIVTDILVEQNKSLREISVVDAYPKHSKVFVMLPSWEGFGYPALVDAVDNDGRVRLTVSIWPTVDLSPLHKSLEKISLQWMNSFEAGRRIGVDGRLISRITGTVFLLIEQSPNEEQEQSSDEKLNIGLSLKLSKKNKEVADYTRRLENGYWEYSILCVRLLNSYRNKFRDLFSFLEKSCSTDGSYLANDVWTNEKKRKERLSELKNWLASAPTYGMEKQDAGIQYADRNVVGYIENSIKQVPKKRWGFRKCSINPNVLYRAELYGKKSCADSEANFMLLDRVVYCVQGTEIPFGLQGTVVGLYSSNVDVLFDQEFESGIKIRGTMNSGANVSKNSLINISYGKQRKRQSVLLQNQNNRPHVDDTARRSSTEKSNIDSRKTQNRLVSNIPHCYADGSRNLGSDKQTLSLTEYTSSSVKENPRRIQVLRAHAVTFQSDPESPSTISSKPPDAKVDVSVLTKDVVENELTKMLGLKTTSAAKDPIPKRHSKEPLAEKELFNVVSPEICGHNKSSSKSLGPGGIHSTALLKLFPQLSNKGKETKKVVDHIGLERNNKDNRVFRDSITPGLHNRNYFFRGRGPRMRASGTTQATQRQNHSASTSTVFSAQSSRNFSEYNRSRTSVPKLTDLKPSSVILPCRRYRGRRDTKQVTTSTQDMSTKRENNVPDDNATATTSTRGFTSTRVRRVRKSRLAPKFSDHNEVHQ
ncbi:hypothetical protein DICVIV_03286 [Dictyocaulus viviparus]|uniref:Uncharacterized protein n=1 Tax=Dictyocaulus viviparus TaxID=29172 RepID=A0A0D8Y2W8_DICVI|nr:hypothetical protein DICVIV_03286 [Dictyocaulus viviparus]